MVAGFGTEAARYAARLPGGLRAVAADFEGAVGGLAAAIERRRAGEIFYAAPLIDDPRALVAQRVSGRWIQAFPDIDARYRAFDALAADRPAESGCPFTEADMAVIDEPTRRVLRDFAIVGSALLVRSRRDEERISRVLGRRRPTVVAAAGVDVAVPPGIAARGNAVVVWAPFLAADRLGVIAMALEYMRCEVIYVCASGRLENVRGDFVSLTGGAAALARAACIVDASIGDPGTAIALSRCGVPVAAAATSGASEYVDGLLGYEPWDWRSVFAAVAVARGARAPSERRLPLCEDELAAGLERSATPVLPVEPLVSIVVVTYNRRELLPLTLDSVARQSYRNIEIIVVNNGGVDVADILDRYDGVLPLSLPENVSPIVALEYGMERCRGKYFCCISDDDEYFPDHFARLVHGLESADAEIGHTNTVTRYVRSSAGVREPAAYRVMFDRPSDRLQILVGGTMAIHSTLFRHDVRAAIGPFRVDIAGADYEYVLRAAQRYDFVHVDAVTVEWNYAIDGSSYTHGNPMYEGLKKIYAEYPSQGSEIVERRRTREIARFEARNDGKPLWPPDLLLHERPRAPLS